jgi:hypothetical protein
MSELYELVPWGEGETVLVELRDVEGRWEFTYQATGKLPIAILDEPKEAALQILSEMAQRSAHDLRKIKK